jgi:transposase
VFSKPWYPLGMERHELSDAQWERLRPLLPPQRPATGRPAKDHRSIVNAILWRLATGVPWRDLPAQYGPWQSVYTRFRRWQQAGVWDRVLAALQADGDAKGELDWELHFVDGTVVRAHQHAAGAQKGAATKPSAAAGAATRPNSTSGPSAGGSRSPSS